MKTRLALALVSLLVFSSTAVVVVTLAGLAIWLLNFDREQAYLDDLVTMLFFLSMGWIGVAGTIIIWRKSCP